MIFRFYQGCSPALSPGCFVAETAVLVGNLILSEGVNVWYGAVLRGDAAPIHVGAGTNLQDNIVVHTDTNFPVVIGENVTVGHGAILHGCTVEDGCLIGMGAILLNGCVVGAGSMVAAGALVTQHKAIPPGSLVMGSPAKVIRPLTQEERTALMDSALEYRRIAALQLPGI